MKNPKYAQSLRQSVAPILRALGASVMAEEAESAAAYIELLESQLESQLGVRNPQWVGPNLQNFPLSAALVERLSEEVKQAFRDGNVVLPPLTPDDALKRLDEHFLPPAGGPSHSVLIALAARAAEEIDEDELEESAQPRCPECNGTGHRHGQAYRAQALRWSCSRCDGTGDSFASAPTKPPETT